jgi:predicted DsbA family dithiol-disulfide isomerase
VVEALFRGYFIEGRDIGDANILADIASRAGMDRARVAMFLQTDEGAAEVRAFEDAARRAGISGVPAFIANRRPLLVGAQTPDIIASALRGVLGLTPAS